MSTNEWRELAARQLEEFTVTTQKYRAENQRLRAFAEWVLIFEKDKNNPAVIPHIIDMAREALAGDTE